MLKCAVSLHFSPRKKSQRLMAHGLIRLSIYVVRTLTAITSSLWCRSMTPRSAAAKSKNAGCSSSSRKPQRSMRCQDESKIKCPIRYGRNQALLIRMPKTCPRQK